MNRRIVLVFAVLFIGCNGNHSSKGDLFRIDSLTAQSNRAAQAFMKGDLETLFRLTPPKVLEAMGGKSGMTQLVRLAEEQMETQGMSFEKVTIGAPSKIFRGGKDLFALVPETTVMKLQDGQMIVSSHLLGISGDDGNTWSFIDASPFTKENIKGFYPEFNDSLVLPGKQLPVFKKSE